MAETKAAASEDISKFGYKQELKRQLQLRDVVLYGVLFMVIIAPQSIYGEVQIASGGMTPLVYIVGFVAISFTAFAYYHMSKEFPIAGSVYSYVQRGINPHVGFVAGWLILLDYLFVPALLLCMVANWGVALIPGSPWYVWVIVFVAFNAFANIRGMSLQKGVDWILFVLEILTVIIFIALGTKFILGGGGAGAFTMDPIYQPGKVDAHFIASAVSLACLSFLGFDGMSTLAEETYQPEKTIGKGILIALCIMVVVFVAQTYIAALIIPDIADVDPEMGFFNAAMAAGGPIMYKALLVINIVAIGIANIMNAQTASARLLYSMGRDGVLPSFLGKVHPKYATPYMASIVLAIFGLALPFLGMSMLARFVNFGALSSFVLLNVAVFWYFWVKKGERGPAAVLKFIVCPAIGIFILAYVFTGFDVPTYLVGGIWLVVGLVIGFVKSKGYKEVPEAFKNLEV